MATPHLVFVAAFASQEDLDEAMASEGMQLAAKDLEEIRSRFGVTPDIIVGPDL